jgi:hypothetical protein
MGSNITFDVTNTYSIGTLSDEASQVYTANVSANGGLALSAGSTNNITFAFNGTSEAILSHTGQWNWSGYIGNTFPGTTADSVLTINNGAVREVPATTFTYTGYGSDSVQQVTSGSTATQTTGYNIVVINPASTLSSMTLTTATAFHSSNDLYILFGGTITSGNAVVTSLTINAGSGLTLVQAVNPNGLTYNAGEMIRYHKIGSLLYRYN